MTASEFDEVQEKSRNKNLEAQKSSEAPVEEAKMSQNCTKQEQPTDNQPDEVKASKKTERGPAEQ